MKNKKIYIFFIGVFCSYYSFSMHHGWSERPWIEIAKHEGIKDKEDFFDHDKNCFPFIVGFLKRLYFTLEDMYYYCTGHMDHEQMVQEEEMSPHEMKKTFVFWKDEKKRRMMQNIAVKNSDIFDENTAGEVELLNASEVSDEDDMDVDMQNDTLYKKDIKRVMSIFSIGALKSFSSSSASPKTPNSKAEFHDKLHDTSNTKKEEYIISSSDSSCSSSSSPRSLELK